MIAELVSLLLLTLLGSAAIAAGRHLDRSRRSINRRVVQLQFPRGVTAEAVESFIRSLAGLQLPRWRRIFGVPAVVFETHAGHDEIGFRLINEAGAEEFVVGQVRRAFPGVRMVENAPRNIDPTLAAELRLSGGDRQLRIDQPEGISSAMLSALRPLERGEELLIEYVVTPSASSGTGHRVSDSMTLWGKRTPAKPDKAMRDKTASPIFLAAIRVAVVAKSPERCRQLMRRILGVFHVMNAPAVRLRRRQIASQLVSRRVKDARTPLFGFPCVLNSKELTALLAVPIGDVQVPGLELSSARQLPVPTKLPQTGPAFAVSNYPGSERLLTFGYRSLPFHFWVIGGTGAGKSTVLRNLIGPYMRADATIVVLDSKRDLAQDVVDDILPRRIGDLVLLDPADHRPVGVNVLASEPSDIDRTADQLLGIFTRLWPGAVGPRSEDILRACFLTLMRTPGTTLVELPPLLQDEGFRRRLTARIDDVILEPQWAAFNNLSAAERAAHIGPPLNKVRAVLARRALRDIVGQSKGLDVADVLERGSILVVPLSKGLIGEDAASLLGSILLSRIWQALTARMGLASTDRRPVLVVLDEFQDYMAVELSFGDMLAQARALGVGVVAAHQHTAQLPGRLLRDLRANARSKAAFQLAAPDARILAQEFSPYMSAEDLQGLGSYEIAAQMCVDGRVLPPATGTTFPPPEPTGAGDQAREFSRQRYGRDRQDVEAEIRRRHGERPGQGTVGRRRRT